MSFMDGFCCDYPNSCIRTGSDNQGDSALVMPRACEGNLSDDVVVIECCLYKSVEPNGSGAFIWA